MEHHAVRWKREDSEFSCNVPQTCWCDVRRYATNYFCAQLNWIPRRISAGFDVEHV